MSQEIVRTKTAEAPLKGHPDVVCNTVANAILDTARDLSKPFYTHPDDPMQFPRTAIECLAKGTEQGGVLVVAGEVTVPAQVESKLDIESIARQTIASIGYTRLEDGFWNGLSIPIFITRQSADIDQGVSRKELGAGDQGSMCGYAIAGDGPEFMPMPVMVARKLATALTDLRETGILPYLRPDGKTQVIVGYNKDGKPVSVEDLTISVSHSRETKLNDLQHDVIQHVVEPVLHSLDFRVPNVKHLHINPTGRFVDHGPNADAGVTGRKIIADAYGVGFAHGGGNWNGKDWTKVDMAGAVAARFVAKNIVAHGLAKQAYVELAYVIGLPDPKSIVIKTFGTGTVPKNEIRKFVDKIMDFRVKTIIRELRLWEQIYTPLPYLGWVGIADGRSWEKIVPQS